MTAALDAALLAIDQQRAVLRRASSDHFHLRGADALDLVHRIAASEVRDLAIDSPRRLIFTDDKGRVVDAPLTWKNETGFTFLTGPGRGDALRTWIEKWIITEDARVEECDAQVVFDLMGAASVQHAEALGTSTAQALLRLDAPVGGLHGHLLVVADRADDVAHQLFADLVAIDDHAIAAWCARAGVARPGPGLAAGCHPLELGWQHWVSFTKGCYIGQEVVARLDTYDKVRRAVVALECEQVPPTGTSVRHAGKKVGVVLEAAAIGGRAHAVAVLDKLVELQATLEFENAGAGTLVRIPAP